MRVWRYGPIVVIAAVCLGLGVAQASACQDPDFSFLPSQAKAGDTVNYTISNTQPGATWKIVIEGQEVASGTDPGGEPGASGSFTMPNLGGSTRDVFVEAVVDHSEDGGHWPLSQQAHYIVPAEDTAQPPPQGGESEPSGTNTTGAASTGQQSPQPHPGQHASQVHHPQHAQHVYEGSSATSKALGLPPLTSGPPTSNASEGPATPPSSPATGARSDREQLALPVAGDAQAPERSGQAFHVPTAVAVPGYAMLVAASLLLVAVGAACLIALRRRSGPDEAGVVAAPDLWIPPPVEAEAEWRSAEIEAELQEMIAEERAEALLSAPSPTPIEVRELERAGLA